jgi:DNA-binding NarL/FixJ family response regulator
MNIRILLADDHKMFLDGLRTMLAGLKGVEVVGEAFDGHECLRLARELKPDLILMDVSMSGLNGIETTRKVLLENPSTRVIVLSMHSDRRYVVESLKSGAVAYVLKDSAFDELAEALRSAMSDKIYLSGKISEAVIKHYIGLARSDEKSAYVQLTAREREVLQLLAEGNSTKDTATKLSLSVKTIETHRKQIMDKLNIHSIAELTKYAIREGLTPLE